jgi:hypothetical protein
MFHHRYGTSAARRGTEARTVAPAISTRVPHRRWIFKKNQKNGKPALNVILCDLVERKNKKLGLQQFLRKTLLKTDYRLQSYMPFEPNELGYELNHGIVFRNEPILGTSVCLGIASNVAEGSIYFSWTKS